MITIKKTDKCDTRVKTAVFTKEDVKSDTIKHIEGVQAVGKFVSDKFLKQLKYHDHTKLEPHLGEFTAALNTHKVGEEFYALPWWKIHETERHHLNQKCPEDVNLIDVMEMICDVVAAGKARTGKVFPVKISDEILQKAVKNTIELLESEIKVIE